MTATETLGMFHEYRYVVLGLLLPNPILYPSLVGFWSGALAVAILYIGFFEWFER
ncbi:hypothetical protein SAMN04490178_12750 [Propionispora vibrioides]|uniref:Uncharacterized protein n=1 Tax=Propionispora vibrioides TaxID=112903 RepID=A0A1H8XQS0_9FIRM|nr:hypothetical protein SAMN04490178_12750 [Propionispora vibrioides]